MRSIVLLVVGVVVVASAAVFVVLHAVGGQTPSAAATADVSPSWTDLPQTAGQAPVPPSATPTVPPAPSVTYPQEGSGNYDVVAGNGAVLGAKGTLMRFQVAVERDITNFDTAAFASLIESTYADPRGWTGGGLWRFQRVGPGQAHDFVVYLVTPGTREKVCGDGRDRYTNCRNGARVVINADRWEQGVPNYGASLADYRQYAINHETGHRLGHGHELCPGPGQPAPVMQQQTLGLHSCVPNSWPYVNGQSYHGKSGAYSDPIPA